MGLILGSFSPFGNSSMALGTKHHPLNQLNYTV